MTRVTNSLKNLKFTLIGQVLNLIITFVSRGIFVHYLGAEYLGINGLFTNLISILSLAELGIGNAITYSLYKPLATKNTKKVAALMRVYKRAYVTIGIFVALIGLIVMPLLPYLIKDISEMPELNIIFILFVASTSVSYFFSYNRALVIADQKKYIDSIYYYIFFLILNLGQIIILIMTHSYVLYLVFKLIVTFAENYSISIKIGKMYPFIKAEKQEIVDKSEMKSILRNIKAMFFHRIGTVVVLGTDNLLLSKFVGVVSVGMYSNYLLILSALKLAFGVVFQSITASVGNLGATEDNERVQYIFDKIDFIGFWIYSFASIALINLFNPFITLWLGTEFIFPQNVVFLIVLNFYIQGQRSSVLTFRDALGLFWNDRYKPIAESLINLIVSIYLVLRLGVIGVLLGTIISTLTTSLWIEPLVLHRYGFNSKVVPYFVNYLKRILVTTTTGIVTWYFCSMVKDISIVSFLLKMVICTLTPNLFFVLIYCRTENFRYLLSLIKKNNI